MNHTPFTVREAVAAKLASSGDLVAANIISQLADAELGRREKLIMAALTKLDTLDKDAKKIRPDQRSLDAEGKLIAETYSAAKFDELKKHREVAERWNAALDKALNACDYTKLTELSKPDAKPADGG
jgi:hypothetical protein